MSFQSQTLPLSRVTTMLAFVIIIVLLFIMFLPCRYVSLNYVVWRTVWTWILMECLLLGLATFTQHYGWKIHASCHIPFTFVAMWVMQSSISLSVISPPGPIISIRICAFISGYTSPQMQGNNCHYKHVWSLQLRFPACSTALLWAQLADNPQEASTQGGSVYPIPPPCLSSIAGDLPSPSSEWSGSQGWLHHIYRSLLLNKELRDSVNPKPQHPSSSIWGNLQQLYPWLFIITLALWVFIQLSICANGSSANPIWINLTKQNFVIKCISCITGIRSMTSVILSSSNLVILSIKAIKFSWQIFLYKSALWVMYPHSSWCLWIFIPNINSIVLLQWKWDI